MGGTGLLPAASGMGAREAVFLLSGGLERDFCRAEQGFLCASVYASLRGARHRNLTPGCTGSAGGAQGTNPGGFAAACGATLGQTPSWERKHRVKFSSYEESGFPTFQEDSGSAGVLEPLK